MPAARTDADVLYEQVVRDHSAAIRRVARAYERDASLAEDLSQEVFLAIWRSLGSFEHRSSARTWIFRVAHNVAVSYVVRAKNSQVKSWVSLNDAEMLPARQDIERDAALDAVWAMVERLQPLDKQTLLSWLEGMSGKEIAEITGLSENAVGVKVHRAKALLAKLAAGDEET